MAAGQGTGTGNQGRSSMAEAQGGFNHPTGGEEAVEKGCSCISGIRTGKCCMLDWKQGLAWLVVIGAAQRHLRRGLGFVPQQDCSS